MDGKASWMKLKDGSWGVWHNTDYPHRCGDMIKVTKKNGETKIARVSDVVWSGKAKNGKMGAIYTVYKDSHYIPRSTDIEAKVDKPEIVPGMIERKRTTERRHTAPKVGDDYEHEGHRWKVVWVGKTERFTDGFSFGMGMDDGFVTEFIIKLIE